VAEPHPDRADDHPVRDLGDPGVGGGGRSPTVPAPSIGRSAVGVEPDEVLQPPHVAEVGVVLHAERVDLVRVVGELALEHPLPAVGRTRVPCRDRVAVHLVAAVHLLHVVVSLGVGVYLIPLDATFSTK
jgi:hypothetical protein